MARLGRGRAFKPSLPIIGSQWYYQFVPRVTIASASTATGYGTAAPHPIPMRADGIGTAYDASALKAAAPSPPTSTGVGAAFNATIVGITIAGAGLASGTGTAYGARGPADNMLWNSTDTIDWNSGDPMDWVS